MKVYLLNPPAVGDIKMVREGRCMQRKGAWTTVWPPISLAYMASVLRKEKHQVYLNDCIVENIDEERLGGIIKDIDPDLVIINTATASIRPDLAVADFIKKINKGIKTAAFGIHVSVLPEESFMLSEGLDFVIRGEPEITSRELARAIEQKEDIATVEGISFKLNGKAIHNKDRAFISNLDSLPFPAWDLVNTHNYLLPFTDKPFLLVTTSKGCPYGCTFCPAEPYYGKTVRLRKPECVVDEMEWLIEKFAVKDFLIWSESFTLNKKFVFDICGEIKRRGLKIDWVCNSRVDAVSLDILKEIRSAGCWMIGYGVESSSQEILDRAKKGITVQQIKDAVRWAGEAKLETTAHVIFGLPGETEKTAQETINFVKGLGLDFAQFYCVVPWPSTKIYKEAREKGWLISDDWSLYEQNYSVLNTDTMPPDKVVKYRKKAIRHFYCRPTIIFKALKRIKSLKELKIFISMLKEFLTWM